MALTFVDTHNMIAYLTKSDASEWFNQIIDFWNASSIKYALTVNPNIYVSCIKQFWTSVSVKTVNDVPRLQALVDKKKVIITEATIRDALRLDNTEGIDCLPNEEIFIELVRMGYKKPSTKLTFYKAFFLSQWKCASVADDVVPAVVDEPSIPSPTSPTQTPPPSQDQPSTSQVQPTLPQSPQAQPPSPQQQPQPLQDADISIDLLHNLLDTCTTLTRRVEHLEQDKIAQALEITKLKQRVKKLERRSKLKVSMLRRLKRVGTSQRVETSDDTVMDDVSKQGRIIADMDANVDVTLKDVAVDAETEENADDDEVEPVELQEVVEVVTTAKLITEVVTATNTIITASTLQLTTTAAPTLTTAPSAARRRKGVVIRDPEETDTPSIIIHSEAKSKDKGNGVLLEEPKPLKKQAQIEQDKAYARELKAELNKNIDWDEVIDHVQRKEKEDNAKFNSNVAFLQKKKEQMEEEEDSRALKRITAKKHKLDEEVEELRKHLQIVPNDDDDVYTEATPLALKVPVIDYEIYTENNKPYYKIKRADGTHQLISKLS
nr:xylulose kinase-1 [Tanacetum cinerariifolium]